MIELYKGKPKKPVIGIFSPHNTLRIITNAEKEGIDVFSKTRFCLDEIHERTVDTDVLVAKLGELTRDFNFKLKVLMMSATPDERVLKCFTKVDLLELPDSQLFPIQDFKFRVPKQNVDQKVVESTIDIISKMANKSFHQGHVLIFTSGNARINTIMGMLTRETEKNSDKCKMPVKIHRNMDSHMTNMKEFVQELEKINLKREDLYILPIKYASFASQGQKIIAKEVIPKYKNIVKVIVATNGIESSITIDELAAVVDSGLVNLPSYDKDKGLTNINEEQITKMSQTQRRGRVGRVRDGIAVQITLDGKKVPDNLPPEILTTDICSNILSLRMMGINLEEIKNLPDKINPRDMGDFILSLIRYNALDTLKRITDIGREMSNFDSLSPFIASAIIDITKRSSNKDLEQILSALIVLIFSSEEFVTDPSNKILQKNFCEDSDVITLLVTLL